MYLQKYVQFRNLVRTSFTNGEIKKLTFVLFCSSQNERLQTCFFFSELESLNLREERSQPVTGFGVGPLFWGMVWTLERAAF